MWVRPAYDAPGFMNLMPNIQIEFGLWYVSGGLYELARAFERRLVETGVRLHLDQTVVTIEKNGSHVTGVVAQGADGVQTRFGAEFVVSNMEVIPANEKLLQEPPRVMKKLAKFEPACSGIVVHLVWTAFTSARAP